MAVNAQFLANLLVPQFSQRLGAFNAQTVKVKIVSVIVGLEKLLRIFTRPPPHRHQVKGNHIHVARVDRSKIIGETKSLARRLSRKSKAHELALACLIINDEIVSRRLTVEVTIDSARD